MLIDFHCHAFPENLASRALNSLKVHIRTEPYTDGTIEGTISKMDEWGVDRSVICNIAVTPKQTTNVNNFAVDTVRKYSDRIIPLGSINPFFDDPYGEARRLADSGIKGIKIHPDYMKVPVDSPDFDKVFDAAMDNDLFVVTHAGLDVCSTDFVYASPELILKRLKRSPGIKLICAHAGGNMMWNEVMKKLIGQDIYIDTSLLCTMMIPEETAAAILTNHPSDRILFGSDCPWCSPVSNRDFILSLGLSDDLNNSIFYRNALNLLK